MSHAWFLMGMDFYVPLKMNFMEQYEPIKKRYPNRIL